MATAAVASSAPASLPPSAPRVLPPLPASLPESVYARVVLPGNFHPVTLLVQERPDGSKCEFLIIGTAHVSQKSADEATSVRDLASVDQPCSVPPHCTQVILATQPDAVFLELCRERASMLMTSSEELIKSYEKELSMKELKEAFKVGWTGILQLVLGQVFRKVVKQIKVAPGEEFRAAFSAARAVGCMLVLGDRPISITLSRTWNALTITEKIKIGYSLLLSDFDLKPEDIERLKTADVLTQLIEELSVALPSIGKVILTERDMFLSANMQRAAPPEVRRMVAIVGMGHVPGIRKYWKETIDLQALMQTPPPDSKLRVMLKRAVIFSIAVGFVWLLWKGVSSSIMKIQEVV